ncbi:MAG: hypothetical protein GTO67_00575 [Gammaproteobacteria bacterium]|nr:hypothetical protein [Gammaproteobacteria bacterium]NIN37259.1 hypothetical protein [Gammaproteobacteria bacterium]NIO26117.1 hypothetical protein [Gammaproteobacteria bacterium]NIO66730.1 hypothetical protein [Gammaproteobacteria bacterium]NIP47530.1 hypothetical protein [Gammaproteobacteria bacterium]
MNPSRLIRVKFMARGMRQDIQPERWVRQLPGTENTWKSCRFIFDVHCREYDWLAVFHDIHRDKWSFASEPLACPREKTLLVTTEPSTITVYGTDYLRQFGVVLTSQEPWVISHPNVVFTQPGLIWFYGVPLSGGRMLTYDEIAAIPPMEKTRKISTVCSSRVGKLTLHYKRVQFTDRLKAELPELDVFGHGVHPMSDKADALDPYEYHIAIENHVYPHHLTEKLPDAFLGYTLPFYHGCPNALDYFPRESFISIDFEDYKRTRDVIRSTIANDEYADRLPYIIEARRRVLEDLNLFAVLEREIGSHDKIPHGREPYGLIMNRQTLRIKRPLAGLRSLAEKAITKSRHKFGWGQA